MIVREELCANLREVFMPEPGRWGLPGPGDLVEHRWKDLGRGTVISVIDSKIRVVRVLWPHGEEVVNYPGGKALKFISSSTNPSGEVLLRFEAKVNRPINYIMTTFKI